MIGERKVLGRRRTRIAARLRLGQPVPVAVVAVGVGEHRLIADSSVHGSEPIEIVVAICGVARQDRIVAAGHARTVQEHIRDVDLSRTIECGRAGTQPSSVQPSGIVMQVVHTEAVAKRIARRPCRAIDHIGNDVGWIVGAGVGLVRHRRDLLRNRQAVADSSGRGILFKVQRVRQIVAEAKAAGLLVVGTARCRRALLHGDHVAGHVVHELGTRVRVRSHAGEPPFGVGGSSRPATCRVVPIVIEMLCGCAVVVADVGGAPKQVVLRHGIRHNKSTLPF